MTIKIVCSSKVSKQLMWARSIQYQNTSGSPKISKGGTVFSVSNSLVLIQKHGLLVNFNSEDKETVANLRKYISHLFGGTLIGVNISNPVTESLEGVHEFLLRSPANL